MNRNEVRLIAETVAAIREADLLLHQEGNNPPKTASLFHSAYMGVRSLGEVKSGMSAKDVVEQIILNQKSRTSQAPAERRLRRHSNPIDIVVLNKAIEISSNKPPRRSVREVLRDWGSKLNESE